MVLQENSELDMVLQLEKSLKNSNSNNMLNIFVLSAEKFLILKKNAVKRACVGIWKCSGCKKSMAGGAWEL